MRQGEPDATARVGATGATAGVSGGGMCGEPMIFFGDAIPAPVNRNTIG
ncbi:hypothetical protein SAMN05444695_106214 [Rhodococcus triatomae]|uniref:Uncharacterized protein n=1 Tax=Rhodococcus triatomae TaxID=300028 RepID=A0A1G8JKW4_9NOCA|nr:hypothetical protein SAMN05444695_106214 [Rhodococcus triatomae]